MAADVSSPGGTVPPRTGCSMSVTRPWSSDAYQSFAREGGRTDVEVSYSEFGERGSLDVLATNEEFDAVAVCEVKEPVRFARGDEPDPGRKGEVGAHDRQTETWLAPDDRWAVADLSRGPRRREMSSPVTRGRWRVSIRLARARSGLGCESLPHRYGASGLYRMDQIRPPFRAQSARTGCMDQYGPADRLDGQFRRMGMDASDRPKTRVSEGGVHRADSAACGLHRACSLAYLA